MIGAVGSDTDAVFRALADPTRRFLLDALHERNGQTLGELCARLAMTRQSATQHLDVLEAANLISTVRSGRQKLHYLNPVPLHEMQQRWIDKFEQPRLRTLSAVKRRAEEQDVKPPTYVYVTYIASTPERVWDALTDADLTAQYWGHANVSDSQEGSTWAHRRTDGSDVADVLGTVLEVDRPRRLVLTFGPPDGESTRVTFDLHQHGAIVKLTVTHEDIPTEKDYAGAAHGWPAVLANLKSLLETGSPLPETPWEVPADA